MLLHKDQSPKICPTHIYMCVLVTAEPNLHSDIMAREKNAFVQISHIGKFRRVDNISRKVPLGDVAEY